jgi:hypothetical protein
MEVAGNNHAHNKVAEHTTGGGGKITCTSSTAERRKQPCAQRNGDSAELKISTHTLSSGTRHKNHAPMKWRNTPHGSGGKISRAH